MKNLLRWIGIFAAIVAVATLLTLLLMWIGGYEPAPSCQGLSRSDCVDVQALSLDRTALIATLIGISLSVIGTLALVVTIYFTSKATAATVEAARAADHAVALARQTASRELRPYIAYDSFSMIYRPAADGRATAWWVRIHWINTGATPAINVRTKTNYLITQADLPDDFDFPDGTVVYPGGSIGREKKFASSTDDITLEQVADIMAHRSRLFVWGWIEYEGFEGSHRYRSEWHSEINLWGVDDPSDVKLCSENVLRNQFNGSDSTAFRPPLQPPAVG